MSRMGVLYLLLTYLMCLMMTWTMLKTKEWLFVGSFPIVTSTLICTFQKKMRLLIILNQQRCQNFIATPYTILNWYPTDFQEIYYCTIILRDAMKLQIPRDNNFSSQGAKPRGMKNWVPRDLAISMHPEKWSCSSIST